MNKRWQTIFISCAAILLYACTGHETSGFSDIDPAGWIYGDTVYFTPSLHLPYDSDTCQNSKGDISIVIRHTNQYEYANIWLELRYLSQDSLHIDTINMPLANEFGKWFGNGIGVSYQYVYTPLENIELDLADTVKISHIMRVDTLKGIEQVGLKFVPIESSQPAI